jgi:hypothetical protein
MDDFLDKYQLQKLKEVQVNNLNNPITTKEREVVTKSILTRKKKKKNRIPPDFQRANTNTPQTIPQSRKRRNIAKLIL